MILAIAALVLQFSAIPPSSVSPTSLNLDASATSKSAGKPTAPADASSTTTAALPAAVRASTAVATPDPGTQPSPAAPFQPGRLTPEPIVAGSPATSGPVAFPSSPGAAAFLASTPAALRSRQEEQRQRRIWLALGIVQSGAATFDAWSTRRVVSSGQGQEANPMLRPFAGNASLYVVIQAAPLVLDYVGHRMMTSQHGWERHTWWMPQAIGTAMSVASGAVNLSH